MQESSLRPTYTYDANGNTTAVTSSGDVDTTTESFTYNARNQLVGYTKGADSVSYGYDGTGMRVSKTQGATTQKYYWDRGYIVNEGTGSTITASNFIGADGIIARKENNVVNYLVKNAHGDVIKYVGASNTKHYDYDPYGNELNANPNDTNPFRYAGEYFDQETGQIYLRNRYYSPSTGRFTQEDPIRDGTNWYTYCAGNPVMYVDPTGLEVTEEDKKNLSENEIKQLEKYTEDWEKAYINGDQLGMDAAHAKAEMLRDTYRGGGTLTINSAVGHAWLTYVTSQGESFTLGTWGSQGDANKRLLFNLEKKHLTANSNSYGTYTYKTVAIDEQETSALLKYAVKMEKNNSWTLGNNCAYFAAKAWEKAGQDDLNYRTKGGYADPAILYYGIANAYRQYGKFGDGVIQDGQTAEFRATQSSFGHLTKPFTNSIYDIFLDGE